ncbi:MAG: SPFH domain-containing protein [Rhodospirillales bacterium]
MSRWLLAEAVLTMGWLGVFGVVVLLVLARSIRIAQEWRRAVVLRLGRFLAVKGPGVYFLWPIDTVAMTIDLRIKTSNITAEQALTRDTVAVGVDAIVFWQVDDPRAAAINIADYAQAIDRVSQTSLREMIGATELSRLLTDRHTADTALRDSIAARRKTGASRCARWKSVTSPYLRACRMR